MKLSHPLIITPRLLAGVRVDKSFISIEIIGRDPDGRHQYRYHIDTPENEHTGEDLRSGCQGGSIQDGLESLLAFLSAAAESYSYTMRTGETGDCSDLFPSWVSEWAYENLTELEMLSCELEESPGLVS
jgi:hypothetical protein